MPSKIQRRDFVVGSFAGATALTGSAAASASSPSDDGDTRELIEIRAFRNTDPAKQAAVLAHVESALLPALDRQGLERVGVFTSVEAADASVYLVIPYATPEQLLHHNDLLESDEAYQSVAADHLAVSMEDPPYTRIESRLTRAFSGMPRLEVPARESAERILELRIYESHNERKARLKVEMFDDGEIDLMREVGLGPVFFGETLISHDAPNLTYMLSADSAADHKAHWNAFLAHPEWDRMKNLERYKGTVSKIESITMRPAAASQI